MPQIKFSHCYQKLLNSHNDVIETAKLIEVLLVDLEDLHPWFISYDTDNGKYKLPKKGKYLMLIFLKPHEDYVTDLNIFTTLRRYEPGKHGFYQGKLGQDFDVLVEC